MKAHFVTFYSPGMFVSEETELPIASWDTETAVKMAEGIRVRHNATPFGFQFTTRQRGPEDLDSHEVERSGMYFLGGKIETLAEVEARNDPQESILRSNMRISKIARVITNTNSWKTVQPFGDDAVLLPFTPPKQGAA